jgi:hypothetical protein
MAHRVGGRGGLGISVRRVRHLINEGILAAEQVVPDAHWEISAGDLRQPRVVEAQLHAAARVALVGRADF